MKAVAAHTFAERLDRFVRWFFTTSPTDVIEPSPKPPAPRSRAVSRRKPPRVRAQHAGPVRVAAKGKS